MVAIGDGDGGGGETRVAVMRWWVGIMKDGGGGGLGRKQFIVDAQIVVSTPAIMDIYTIGV